MWSVVIFIYDLTYNWFTFNFIKINWENDKNKKHKNKTNTFFNLLRLLNFQVCFFNKQQAHNSTSF